MNATSWATSCVAILWLAAACSGDIYNPGDPTSEEWLETRLLECLVGPDCPNPRVHSLAEGFHNNHNVLLSIDGGVRAWGDNTFGQLGFSNTTNVGDGTGPTIIAAGDVPVGGTSSMLAASNEHTCALLSTGAVRCWGNGAGGRLGHNSVAGIGDGVGSTIIAAGDVPVGGNVTRISAGNEQTCALLATGNVRCWGNGGSGRLGYNNTTNVGDGGTSIIAAGDVPIGQTASDVSVGDTHACALLSAGDVRCWGTGGSGRLGYGNTITVGDGGGTPIITAGNVPVGGTVIQIASGNAHTCALLSGGTVRCWGKGTDGRLGYNSTANVGDGGVAITTAGDVAIGGTVTRISAAIKHTCALLTTGAVRCWGAGSKGRLGYGNETSVGDGVGPTIIQAGDVPLGGTAVGIVTGSFQTCAIMSGEHAVRCWGAGSNGRLGGNSTANVGDGAGLSITEAGDVPYQ